MRTFCEILLVSTGGFIIMVLEIAGVRFLTKDFGGSFYVWISQIGMVMAALAFGYFCGGWLADQFPRPGRLAPLLAGTALFIAALPVLAPPLIGLIIQRHPLDRDIPMLWQKVDPALGSAVLFLLPCFVLAMLSPFTIRLAARALDRVGSASGRIYAASTVGSIAGVFVTGYALLDWLSLPAVFLLAGGLTLGLAGLCWYMNRFYAPRS
ncbi:fused MFS/spermidine synthase [Fontisphaera persica]|uniref:fused MFS/spermidine synthase n=1 Tax=Fontisphaera persica TaxID=2974023 RepID=UPI0024C06691|nr:fused MFS/spermidine synthase [Fontisphaera persica]WCJ58394.1 fused MFS/spermidine synthase [Fontisphaera persica]